MSTLKATNLQHASATSPNITLGSDGSVAVGGGNISPQTGFKNRIINGDMRIDQRNAGASVTATAVTTATYTVDRWAYYVTQASKFTIQQNAGSVTPPSGFTNYLGVTSSSTYSITSSDRFSIQQPVEGFNMADLGWGTANASPVTMSFWVRSSLTGVFGGALLNDGTPSYVSYPFSFTINTPNTWEFKTINIAGPTTGTWQSGNSRGIQVIFGLGVGSTLSGTAGAWAAGVYIAPTGATSVVGTNGATFYITGVQLEKGSVATPFEFRSIGQELALCQRYYQKSYNVDVAPGTNTTSGAKTSRIYNTDPFIPQIETRLLVSMRASPTVTWYTPAGTSGAVNVGGGTNTVNTQYDAGMNSTGWILVNGSVSSGNQITAQFVASSEL